MIHEFTGMADDGFGNLVLVPPQHIPSAVHECFANVKHCGLFAKEAPYKVAYFKVSGWYTVQNARGENCIRFAHKPGAVFADVAAVAVMAARKFESNYRGNP